MIRRILPVFLTLAALSLQSLQLHAQPAKPAAGTRELLPQDIEQSLGMHWYGLYLQGAKIGYVQSGRFREEPSGNIVESMLMKMKLTSFRQRAEIDLSQKIRFESKPPYRMIDGEQTESDGASKQSFRLVRQGGKFESISNIGGQQTKKLIEALDYTLPDALAAELWIRRAPKPDDKFVTKDLDLEEASLDETTNTLMSDKVSLVNGVKVRFFEVKTRTTRFPIDMLARHDEKGRMLSGNFAIFEIRAEPEEQAKNTQYSQDLFVLGMAKVNRPLGEPDGVKSLVLEVIGEEGKLLTSGPRQTITQKTPKSHVLKLGKRYGTPAKVSDKEIADSLRETADYPLGNARIKELAREAVGDAKTAEEKVKRLVAFVHGYIRPNLSATLPNIPDLLARKKGDCKSYALLFNTLARAAGVPAREVSGLLYVGDDSKAFGGHAWNEVVLNGEWVPVDASMGETEVNATHICYGDERQSVANLLGTLGKLSFRVIEIERGE